MKKVGVAVAVAVLVGCMSSSVFAQQYPRGAEMSSDNKVDQAHIQRQAAAAQQEQQRNHKKSIVQHMLGTQPINLSYELTTSTNPQCQMASVPTCGNTTPYGSFKGRVLVDNAQKQNYILISAEVWQVIDNMSDIGFFSGLGGTRIVEQKITTDDGHEYTQAGNKQLNAQSWKVGDKRYTLISFPFPENKSDKK